MASSTVSGIGSGVDTQAIVTALVNAEKAPKQAQIDKQTTATSTTLSGISVIKSALDTYRAAIAKLNTSTAFGSIAGMSSDEKIATTTVTDSATNGTYALEVTQLATASKISSAVFADGASSVVNSGTESTTLTISQSDADYDVTIAAGSTLEQARDAINTQLKAKNITANILTDANGSRLVLSSGTTGKDTELTLSGAEELTKDYVVMTVPQNAKYTLDKVELESASNSITSLLSGVSIELIAEGKSTLTVSSSTAQLKTSAQAFVTAYNALITAINGQTKVTPGATATGGATIIGGALTGDATMRSLISSVRKELVGGDAGSGSSGLNMLSQLGINTDKTTGLLAIDDAKWDKGVKAFGSEVAELFTGDNGLIKRMTNATDAYAKSGGVLAQRQTNLTDTLGSLKDDQEALTRRIATLQTTLTAKYTAMDTLVAQLNATSKSIMTTLNALNKTDDD
ncbi:flagellar filament capping protein FliD [Pseudomonas fluorescens]|uniref:Flagellar hook-associated protein 2 n=1 Tax=Pseudomonas fluorescens TaxID=294 RepID=A0A5E7CIM3_PSEFL|nr:flagellar filament capping protein FliD [Pseudomonas fluorescens]VVN95403.1 B-type flagellar hook-associated protein 2 [Pseudomonas fluorescens]